MERSQKLALLQRNSINLVSWGRNAQSCRNRVVFKVSGIMWNSGLVVCSVLCVKINRSIMLSHDYLTVVIRQNLKFDDLTINASQTFQRKFCGIVYFYLRSVDPCSNDVALVFGYFNLVGGDLELKILDELDSSFVLLVVFERFTVFVRIFHELRVGFSSWHVVGLYPIYLGYFVHQQWVL